MITITSVAFALIAPSLYADTSPPKLGKALKTIQAIGAKGKGNTEAIEAMKVVSKSSPSQIPEILKAMTQQNPIANNWIRAGVEAIVDKAESSNAQLPKEELFAFVKETKNANRAREMAFQIVSELEPERSQAMVDSMLNDPSVELRRMAVEKLVSAVFASNKKNAIAEYQRALSYARDKDQIESISEKLEELGQEVDLSRHFGFIMKWHLIAPFDNTDKSGFDKVYPPENSINLDATYTGKNNAKAKWSRHTTDEKYGLVDLNKVLGNEKGAIAYAFSEFQSNSARDAEFRLGCINANKIWLNGELLTANHVYHAGRGIDQYSAKGKLKKGLNTILLKIAQNEQTEPWAQDWQFQLRVCDAVGTAILSADRVAAIAN